MSFKGFFNNLFGGRKVRDGVSTTSSSTSESSSSSIKPVATPAHDEPTSVPLLPEVLVDFRPHKKWKGEFGFDWIRKNDTKLFGDNKYEDIVSKQYKIERGKEVLEMDGNERKGIFKKDYIQFQKLKKIYGTFMVSWLQVTDDKGVKKPYEHAIQWMSLLKDRTAKLNIIIKVGEKADYLEFDDNDNFEITPKNIKIRGRKNIREIIKITCKKEFKKDQEIVIKAYKKETPKKRVLAGQINAWANHSSKQKRKKIVFVQVKTPELIPTKGERKVNASSEQIRINKYLNQAFIHLHPDSKIVDLDLTKDKGFADYVNGSNKIFIDLPKDRLDDFLKKKLQAQFKGKYNSYFQAFYFAEVGNKINRSGVPVGLGGYSQPNADYVVVFKNATEQTAAHEFLHAFKLSHSFTNSEAKHSHAKFTYEALKTDNLLDYSHHVPGHLNDRCSLWYWQWIVANKSI